MLAQLVSAVMAGLQTRRPAPWSWPLLTLAWLLAALAFGFLIFAAYLGLGSLMTAPIAALVLAAALFFLAALLLVIALLLRRSAETRTRSGTDPAVLIEALLAATGKNGSGEDASPSSSHWAVLALLAGLAYGYSPAFRQAVRKLLGQLFK